MMPFVDDEIHLDGTKDWTRLLGVLLVMKVEKTLLILLALRNFKLYFRLSSDGNWMVKQIQQSFDVLSKFTLSSEDKKSSNSANDIEQLRQVDIFGPTIEGTAEAGSTVELFNRDTFLEQPQQMNMETFHLQKLYLREITFNGHCNR